MKTKYRIKTKIVKELEKDLVFQDSGGEIEYVPTKETRMIFIVEEEISYYYTENRMFRTITKEGFSWKYRGNFLTLQAAELYIEMRKAHNRVIQEIEI